MDRGKRAKFPEGTAVVCTKSVEKEKGKFILGGGNHCRNLH
jgi:hypothetical protein